MSLHAPHPTLLTVGSWPHLDYLQVSHVSWVCPLPLQGVDLGKEGVLVPQVSDLPVLRSWVVTRSREGGLNNQIYCLTGGWLSI